MAVERNSSEETFRTRYEQDRPDAAPNAAKLVSWAKHRGLLLRPRAGETHDSLLCFLKLGANEHKIFTLETNGLVWIVYKELERRFPSTDVGQKAAFFTNLRERLQGVSGGRAAAGTQGGKASWMVASTDILALVTVLDWVIEELRHHHTELLSSSSKRRKH